MRKFLWALVLACGLGLGFTTTPVQAAVTPTFVVTNIHFDLPDANNFANSGVPEVIAGKTYAGTATLNYYGATGEIPLANLELMANNPNVAVETQPGTTSTPGAPSGSFVLPFTVTVTGADDTYDVANFGLRRTDGGTLNGTSQTLTFHIRGQETDTTEPEKPVDPEKPVNPEKPVDPEKPVNHEKPVDPEKPVNPAKPVDPEKPVNPAKPVDPEKPVNPAKPIAPARPITPITPTTPLTPRHRDSTTSPTTTQAKHLTARTKTTTQPLPQTGDAHSLVALISGAALLIACLVGWRRRG